MERDIFFPGLGPDNYTEKDINTNDPDEDSKEDYCFLVLEKMKRKEKITPLEEDNILRCGENIDYKQTDTVALFGHPGAREGAEKELTPLRASWGVEKVSTNRQKIIYDNDTVGGNSGKSSKLIFPPSVAFIPKI